MFTKHVDSYSWTSIFMDLVIIPVLYYQYNMILYTVKSLDFVVTQFSLNSSIPLIHKLTSSTNQLIRVIKLYLFVCMKQYTKSRPFKPEASHEHWPLQIIWFHSISFQWILWINSTMKAMNIGIKPILIKPLYVLI